MGSKSPEPKPEGLQATEQMSPPPPPRKSDSSRVEEVEASRQRLLKSLDEARKQIYEQAQMLQRYEIEAVRMRRTIGELRADRLREEGAIAPGQAAVLPGFSCLGLDFVKTCNACPEQYDVYAGVEKVGYLRLRHGTFRVHLEYAGGPVIYESRPNGDGKFEDDEREIYLTTAAAYLCLHRHAVKAAIERTPNGSI